MDERMKKIGHFCFGDWEAATNALDEMRREIKRYGYTTVCKYYNLLGRMPRYSDTLYGWTSLDGVSVTYDTETDGWVFFGLKDPITISPLNKHASDHGEWKTGLSSDKDMVNHPPHYNSETGLEVIDVIEAFTFDLKGIEATDTGNIIKYICRWNQKNGVEDLKKAQWYLNHLIKHIENLEKEND